MTATTPSRERILEATIALLESEGEGGLKIEKVAEAAHVAKQSLYHYFTDREGLIVAAQAERYRRGLTGRVHIVLDHMLMCRDGEEFARLVVATGLAALGDGGGNRRDRVHALGSAIGRPELREAIRAAHRASCTTVTKIFAYGQVRGWVDTTYPPSVLAELWFSAITGYYLTEEYASGDDVAPTGRAIVDAVSAVMFGRTFPELTAADAPDAPAIAAG